MSIKPKSNVFSILPVHVRFLISGKFYQFVSSSEQLRANTFDFGLIDMPSDH